MRKLILATSLVLAGVALASCGVNVSQPSASTAKQAVEKLRYAQDDRTGLCFGVVSSSSVGHVNDQSMTITWVPCDPKVLAMIEK